METIRFNPQDRGVLQNLTKAIEDLANSYKPDSFHNRQVPALKRQTEALDHLRGLREAYSGLESAIVSKKQVLEIIDEVTEILLST